MSARDAAVSVVAVGLAAAALLGASHVVNTRREGAQPQAPAQPMTAADLTPLAPLLNTEGLPPDTYEEDAP